MRTKTTGFCVLALACALTVSAAAPASAEFFGCNDRNKVTYSTRAYSPSYRQATSRYTHEFAAQSSRRMTYAHRSYGRYTGRWR